MSERRNRNYDWHTPPSATGAPSRLTVATCQIPVENDFRANVDHMTDLIRRAAVAGADVAHFPECAISGYGGSNWPSWDGFDSHALENAVSAIRNEAHANAISVVAGTVHRTCSTARPTNSILVFDRRGEVVGRYDKQRCSVNDRRAFAPRR